jgi:RNA polymerase sigma factor FliA
VDTETSAPVPSKVLKANASEAYANHSQKAREEEWIVSYLPMVRHIVNKIAGHLGRRADLDDLIAAGTLGLVKAARAFDPSKHAEFGTYAYIRIQGEVIDELRGRSFVPVESNRSIRRVQEAHQMFLSVNGREPDDEELAAQAGLPIEKLYKSLEDARRRHFLSIHGLKDGEPSLGDLLPDTDEAAPESQVERAELVERLTQAIQDLPERDRTVILLYYERDLTMKEIAATLEVTESRVSQMHAGALFRLSMRLRGDQ